MDFSRYPKVELHLHLDCSLSYQVVERIDPSITEEAFRHDFIAPRKCTNLADFLTRAPHSIALMQTEEQLRLVILDLFEQFQRDHVLYAEMRFAPLLHIEKGLTPERVVEVVDVTVVVDVDIDVDVLVLTEVLVVAVEEAGVSACTTHIAA